MEKEAKEMEPAWEGLDSNRCDIYMYMQKRDHVNDTVECASLFVP